MKIVTDFDGTLTDIHGEYNLLLDIINKRLEKKHFPVDRYQQLFDAAIREIKKDYMAYGWMDHDRITAYSDEDLFMNIIAGMKIVDNWLCKRSEYSDLYDILVSQNTSLMEISEYCYFIMHTMPLSEMNTPTRDAVITIQSLLEHGHEVVVVSNSPSARIVQKLNHVGLQPAEHDIDPRAIFKVRGNAAKFKLADAPIRYDFGRPVDIHRPQYQKILIEEKPDIVIGDVFSLDLALPAALTETIPELKNTRIALLERNYTPEWAIKAVSDHPNGRIYQDFGQIMNDLG